MLQVKASIRTHMPRLRWLSFGFRDLFCHCLEMWVASIRDSADSLALDVDDGSRDKLDRLETQLFYGRYCDKANRCLANRKTEHVKFHMVTIYLMKHRYIECDRTMAQTPVGASTPKQS